MYYSKCAGTNHVTLASDIPYLKARKWAIVSGVVASLVLVGVITHKVTFKTIIKPTIQGVKSIKIVTKPGDLDVVILKDGSLHEGRIAEETDDMVTLSLYMKKDQGVMTFKRTEVLKIKYGSTGLHDGKTELFQPE